MCCDFSWEQMQFSIYLELSLSLLMVGWMLLVLCIATHERCEGNTEYALFTTTASISVIRDQSRVPLM